MTALIIYETKLGGGGETYLLGAVVEFNGELEYFVREPPEELLEEVSEVGESILTQLEDWTQSCVEEAEELSDLWQGQQFNLRFIPYGS